MAGDGVAKFDPKAHVEATKAEWLRKQRVFREMYYSKSKLPPMTIEPFPFERERLPFKMTAEDRALRHQWIQDQVLSKNEPRYIPELHPKNFFRRIYGAPWDYVTKYVTASMVRYFFFESQSLSLTQFEFILCCSLLPVGCYC